MRIRVRTGLGISRKTKGNIIMTKNSGNLLSIHQGHHIIHNFGLFLLQRCRIGLCSSTRSLSPRHRLSAVFSFNVPIVLLGHITINYIPHADRITVDLAFGLVVGGRVLAHEKNIGLHILQSSVLIVVEFCLRSQLGFFSSLSFFFLFFIL